MYSAVSRTCAAFLSVCLLAFSTHLQRGQSAQQPANERVWLAVEEQPRGQLRIEPIAAVTGNELTPIQTSCLSDTESAEDFSAPYLQPSTKYTLFFGGANAGEIVVGEPNLKEHIARVEYAGPAKIRGQVRALASNADSADFRVGSRETATAEERAAATVLAREIFAQHGVSDPLLPKVRAEYVTRTYLAPSPQASLIGSFSLDAEDNEGLVHGLFFIASQSAEKLQPEFVWLRLSESENDEELLRFVDHADLFGAGDDEVVAKLISVLTQSHRYLIFRRNRSRTHWEQIFSTEPLGCSY
jgi:hypothetical protein